MKEYIYESVVREVKFEKVNDKLYNVYISESVLGTTGKSSQLLKLS